MGDRLPITPSVLRSPFIRPRSPLLAASRRWRSLLIVPFVLLLLASPAGAAPRMELAVQDDPTFLDPVTRPAALALAAGLHATTVRFNVRWAQLNGSQAALRRRPRRVRYAFAALDGAISAARANGMRIQLTLSGPAPAWATSDHHVGVTRPDAKQFALFARVVASRYRGEVVRYSLWNEPNLTAWLRGGRGRSSAAVYRALFLAGSQAVRGADRRAKILIGETSPLIIRGGAHGTQPIAFLRAVACVDRSYHRVGRCRPLRADGYAHHPYEFTHTPGARAGIPQDAATIGTLDHLTRALDRLRRARALTTPRGRALDLYLTEFGYFAHGPRTLSDLRRAAYLPEAFEIARRNPRVHEMLQYMLLHQPWASWDTALVSRDGIPDPAYHALANWAAKGAAAGLIAG